MGTAPPYDGEGPFALWHFSEDPDLHRFEPHRAPTSAVDDELVWAIDTRHAPHYWFPRDCPRGCAWLTDATTDEDRVRFLGHSKAVRLYVMETAWVPAMLECELYAYRMPEDTFEQIRDDGSGHWVSRQPVEALERVAVGNLFERIAAAGIELRITSDIWPFWHSVIYSTLHFSGTRLRNTTNPEPPEPPRPRRFTR
ncbi:MAG TPA: hypothetical protein VF230_18640 [Acidimicrobiales bacterium]